MTDTGGSKPMVGLIGAIGAGKSTVADRLRTLGATVIDADRTGHDVLRIPSVRDQLTQAFGPRILGADQEVDRKVLGSIVFADASERARLESIVHPAMLEEFRRLISSAWADPSVPMIVLDAAILLEVGWDQVCDRIVFVDAPRETRLDRLVQNRGWSEEELDRRERAQWSNERKKARADVIIENVGTKEECQQKVDRLYREWVE